MADEYVKLDDVLKLLNRNSITKTITFSDGISIYDSAQNLPTADVVPKSEVERLIGKFECFLCHATGGRLSKYTYDLGTMESVATDCINETYNDGYGEGYKECAREIFEEIEKITIHRITTPFGLCLMSMGEAAFAELKKKYTEDK